MPLPVHELAIALPRVLPVLDLRGGLVVRGIAGERAAYRPIETPLVGGSDPLAIATAIRDRFGLNSFYVADLDGIERGTPDVDALTSLTAAGFRLSVDAGVRTVEDAQRLLELGVHRIIAGLETSSGPAAVAKMLDMCTPGRLVFSLDLRRGTPLTPVDSAWSGRSAHAIAGPVISLGIETLLILDLAGVGRDGGIPTLGLVRELRERFPATDLWTGGGVRDESDLTAAAAEGADAVLVASALHSGRIKPSVPDARSVRDAGAGAMNPIVQGLTPPGSPLCESVDEQACNARQRLVAELTAPGRGAVSTLVIRGPLSMLDQPTPLFAAVNGRPLAELPLQRICFGRWGSKSPEEVVLCRTAEDAIEVHCHGGRAAVGRIIRDLESRGAGLISGREHRRTELPFLEAECDAALALATTERTAMLIAEQRSGVLRAGLQRLHRQLTAAATGDTAAGESARRSLERHLHWARFGLHLTRPWSVVLCGRPNTGKSSLINALAGFTRSIVSPQPGTTRDVVTVPIVLEGWPIELSDTAGLRATDDAVESEGVRRARARLDTADLKLLLLDQTAPLTPEDRQLLADHPNSIVIAHKSDLPPQWGAEFNDIIDLAGEPGGVSQSTINSNCPGPDGTRLASDPSCFAASQQPHALLLQDSSVTGAGVAELMQAITERLVPRVSEAGTPIPVTEGVVTALRQARAACNDADWQRALTTIECVLLPATNLHREATNA